jgi:hypothetical protein
MDFDVFKTNPTFTIKLFENDANLKFVRFYIVTHCSFSFS